MGRWLPLMILLTLASTLQAARLGEPQLVHDKLIPEAQVVADGTPIVVKVRDARTVNLWQLAASRWVIALGLVALIVCAGVLRSIFRLWRARPRSGGPLCWQCGYNLRGLISARCPECGQALSDQPRRLTTPVMGPIALRVGAVVLVLAGWVVLWRVHSPFLMWSGPEWFNDEVYAWATRKNVLWICDRTVSRSTIERLDPTTGKPMAQIVQVARLPDIHRPVRVTPDGEHMMLMTPAFEVRTLSDGRVVSHIPGVQKDAPARGLSIEGEIACLETTDQRIYRWRWRDGTLLPAILPPGEESRGWILHASNQCLTQFDDGRLGLASVDAEILRWFEPLPRAVYRRNHLTPDAQCLLRERGTYRPEPTPSCRGILEFAIEVWDIPKGKLRRVIPIGQGSESVAIDRREQSMFVLRQRDDDRSIVVETYDATSGERTAEVVLGAGESPSMFVTTDGLTLIVTAYDSTYVLRKMWKIPITYDD